MRLLLLKPLFFKTLSNLLTKSFEKSSQKNVSFDLILLLAKIINRGMVVSAGKCVLILSLSTSLTKENRKITSTKKIIYSF